MGTRKANETTQPIKLKSLIRLHEYFMFCQYPESDDGAEGDYWDSMMERRNTIEFAIV